MPMQYSGAGPDFGPSTQPESELGDGSGVLSLALPAGTRLPLYGAVFKRCLDLLFILFIAPPALMIVLLVAATIAVLDGHNPFYSQDRIGRGGRSFRLWKLRSMVPQAERLLESYLTANPEARQEWETTQKLKADPRITPLGGLIRKCSIDELPQLWNVLVGDMSLVGPRPMMVSQACLYPGESYYRLRPGITGSWQVSDRNESTFAARAKFDDAYAENLSLRTDLGILARTFAVVLRCTGH